jgi:futalosine hydrolase
MRTKKRPLILVPSNLEAEALRDLDLEIKVCGVGVIEAAIESYKLMERLEPDFVILTGLAGAYPDTDLVPGDIVIASKEIWADSGKKLSQDYLPLADSLGMIREIEIDESLTKEAFLIPEAVKVKRGAVCTVCACSYEFGRAVLISKKYGALAENMEGFAVALAAQKAGIPFAEVRAISNLLKDPEAPWNIEKALSSLRRFWKCQKLP